MAPVRNWELYVSIFVPLLVVVTSIVLAVMYTKPAKTAGTEPRGCEQNKDCQNGGICVDKKCKCTDLWTGDRCQTLKLAPNVLSDASCGLEPRECTTDVDCLDCGGTVPFTCQAIQADKNQAGLEGNFCLPAKPTDNCAKDVCVDISDAKERAACYSQRIPGTYYWQGWKDVETQMWSCACEYPDIYAPAIGNFDSGACKLTTQVCKYGVWKYPCKPDLETGKCKAITKEEEQALVGASPLLYGRCQCDEVPCSSPEDCASGECRNGVCQNQKVALDKNGVPVCVRDTCAPNGRWVGETQPPYSYGRCLCAPGAIDTGYSCYMKPEQPPDTVCKDNCNSHGTCLTGNTCLCYPGYTGETCSEFKCDDNCGKPEKGGEVQVLVGTVLVTATVTAVNKDGSYNLVFLDGHEEINVPASRVLAPSRGNCVGPNQCSCAPGYVFVNNECLRQVTCYPSPTVDPETGNISNFNQFPDALNVACGTGTAEQYDALCKSSPCFMQEDNGVPTNCVIRPDPCRGVCAPQSMFDGYRGGKCYKNVDCSKTACTDPVLCSSAVTPTGQTVYQVPMDSTTCRNPNLREVQDLCSSFSTDAKNYVLNDQFRCVQVGTRDTLTLYPEYTDAVANWGLSGIFCVADVSDADKAADGGGLIASWRVWLLTDDEPIDESVMAFAGGVAKLTPVVPDVTMAPCTGYLYAFEAFFSGTPAESLPVGTRISFGIYAYPVNKWTCPAESTSIFQCAVLYKSPDFTTVELALDPQSKEYCAALKPVLDPCTAYLLANNMYTAEPMFTKKLLTAAMNVPATEDTPAGNNVIADADAEFLAVSVPTSCDSNTVVNQNDLAVQVACTSTYCLSFGGGPGAKVVLIAWKNIESSASVDYGESCPNVNTLLNKVVKYVLARQYAAGAPVPLITKQGTPLYTTDKQYCYFVDVLPVQPQPWTYTLAAYVARSLTDVSTSYESSPCKSRPFQFNILVEPYTEAFCQSLPPPDPTQEIPSFMWLQDGMCTWEYTTAAADYDCAIRSSTFNPEKMKLVDAQKQCSDLLPSYPALNNWSTVSCNPGQDGFPADVCILGRKQTREATCSPQLLLANGGTIKDSGAFAARMSNLYTFYAQHHLGAEDPAIVNALTHPTELYNQYYHCALDKDAAWGTPTSRCEPGDDACAQAQLMASACGVTNSCESWINLSVPGDEELRFQQSRTCFPDKSYQELDPSPCCSDHGTYTLDLAGQKGTCDCRGSTYSNDCDQAGANCGQCAVNVCEGKDCSFKGTCRWVGDKATGSVRCDCVDGYYNFNPKSASEMYPATPNEWACSRNECPKQAGILCGGTPLLEQGAGAPFFTVTLPDGSTQKKYINNKAVVKDDRGGSYYQVGECDYGTGMCMCADSADSLPVTRKDLSAGWACLAGNTSPINAGCNTLTCAMCQPRFDTDLTSACGSGETHFGDPRWCPRTTGIYKDAQQAPRSCAEATKNFGPGYMCDASLSTGKRCKRVEGNIVNAPKFQALEDCRCFSCLEGKQCGVSGETDPSSPDFYSTESECLFDETRKCGWKWKCNVDDPSGQSCILDRDGIYDEEEDCKCFACNTENKNECNFVVGIPGTAKSCGPDTCQPYIEQFAFLPGAYIEGIEPPPNPVIAFDTASQLLMIGQSGDLMYKTIIPAGITGTATEKYRFMYVGYYVDNIWTYKPRWPPTATVGFNGDPYASTNAGFDVSKVSPEMQFAVVPVSFEASVPTTVFLYVRNAALRISTIAFSRYSNLTVEEATVPFGTVIQAGEVAPTRVGSYCSPDFAYFPVSPPFSASTSKADITVTDVQAAVTGGKTPSYVFFAVVVASVQNGRLDPTANTYTSPTQVMKSFCPSITAGFYPEVNVGANVAASADKLSVTTASTGFQLVPTFGNTRIPLQPGLQYQVFIQVFGQSDNSISVKWSGGSVSLVA